MRSEWKGSRLASLLQPDQAGVGFRTGSRFPLAERVPVATAVPCRSDASRELFGRAYMGAVKVTMSGITTERRRYLSVTFCRFIRSDPHMLNDPFHLILLLAAAFVAGALNAVAGGGSFLTLPALVFVGMPPVVANATGTVALLPGYVSGALGFREDLQAPPGLSLRTLTVLSLVGGAIGAALLLVTDDKTFSKVVPWLLLLATVLFALGPILLRRLKGSAGEGTQGARASAGKSAAGMLAVSIYGGYFNGGLGILLLALFGLLGQTKLNAMNGMKNVVSALLTAIAVAIYAWGGVVAWPQALVMMVAATAGGYFGARLARRIPAPLMRAGIVLTGLVMTVLFFLR